MDASDVNCVSSIADVPRQGSGIWNRHTHRGCEGRRVRDWGPDALRIVMQSGTGPQSLTLGQRCSRRVWRFQIPGFRGGHVEMSAAPDPGSLGRTDPDAHAKSPEVGDQ